MSYPPPKWGRKGKDVSGMEEAERPSCWPQCIIMQTLRVKEASLALKTFPQCCFKPRFAVLDSALASLV